MRIGKSIAELHAQLHEVDAEIAAHPFNSPQAVEANEVIETFESLGKERIIEELHERGLPSLDQHGLLISKGAISFGRLHRRRMKILRRLEQLRSDDD